MLNIVDRIAANLIRPFRQSKDANFIGFDKYKNKGAFHWQALHTNPHYRKKIEEIRRFIAKDDRALDLGCGDGAYMYSLSKYCREVIGVDADFDAIRVARRKFSELQIKNCRCYQYPFSQVTPDKKDFDTKFDFVYSMDVIEHLPNPMEILDTAFRFVKPGGLVAIGTPLFITKELISPYHVKEFTQEEIRGLLKEKGPIVDELVLPMERKDGKVYERGFYIGLLNAK